MISVAFYEWPQSAPNRTYPCAKDLSTGAARYAAGPQDPAIFIRSINTEPMVLLPIV